MKQQTKWKNKLKFDPLPLLLSSKNQAIVYFTKRDLLGESVGNIEDLWIVPEAKKLLKQQQSNGSWNYSKSSSRTNFKTDYTQYRTWWILNRLIDMYGFNKKHPAIKKAAEFMFSFQTQEGDFRGVYGNQYTPNYSASILELLSKAGYHNDSRIKKGFSWLLSIKQDDGGWAIPFRTKGMALEAINNPTCIKQDKSKPFSHLITGIVLHAFATHPVYKKDKSAKVAGELLTSRFFERDKYPDRQTVEYWKKLAYPFQMTDFLTSLDSLSLIGFTTENDKIKKAIKWIKDQQKKDGLFTKKLTGKNQDYPLWISFVICKVFKRFYG